MLKKLAMLMVVLGLAAYVGCGGGGAAPAKKAADKPADTSTDKPADSTADDKKMTGDSTDDGGLEVTTPEGQATPKPEDKTTEPNIDDPTDKPADKPADEAKPADGDKPAEGDKPADEAKDEK